MDNQDLIDCCNNIIASNGNMIVAYQQNNSALDDAITQSNSDIDGFSAQQESNNTNISNLETAIDQLNAIIVILENNS